MIRVSSDQQDDSRADFFQHDVSPHARCKRGDDEIDRLDADERQHDAAEAIDQQIASQQRPAPIGRYATPFSASGISAMMISALKMIADRIALCGVASCMTLSTCQLRIEGDEDRRDDGEIFRDVVGDRESGQRAARHQQLFADLDHLDQLGRVGIEIDHVAGFARGLRAGLHGDADIGLGKRRRIVGAVAAHGDQPALRLLARGYSAACPRALPRR